jgi:hypothetical protein
MHSHAEREERGNNPTNAATKISVRFSYLLDDFSKGNHGANRTSVQAYERAKLCVPLSISLGSALHMDVLSELVRKEKNKKSPTFR